MNTKFSRASSLALAVLGVAIITCAGFAFAASTIDSVTLDGSSSVSVAPGAPISAAVTNTSLPDAPQNRWKATAWRIATTPPGATTCADDPSGNDNHQGVATTTTFTIAAPATPGVYNAYFIAYSENDCTQNPSTLFTLSNAVTVVGDITVTIHKYVDGVHADVTNAEGLSFPMQSSWSNAGFPDGGGTFSLAPATYDAQTSPMDQGANYSTNEVLTDPSVGASCADGKPFALVAYSTGDTEALAAAATQSPTSPAFTNITSDKHVIVWNENCPETDLVAIKTNNTSDAAFVGVPFNWIITISNPTLDGADGASTFFTTEDILRDDLPTSGASYGIPVALNGGGTTGTVSCAIVSNTLTCEASGTVVIPDGGTITVTIPVTPTAVGSLVNPQSGGTCAVDPDNVVTENFAGNNLCGNTVDVTLPPDIKVTIVKYIGANHATPANANGATFPMASSWDAVNLGGPGSGTYTLSPVGFNTPNPYEAVTSDMTNGSDYSTNEDTSTPVVGASCSPGTQFILVGYSTGGTLALAQAASVSLVSPAFTNITSDKFVIVWNRPCPGILVVKKVLVNDSGSTSATTTFKFKVNGGTAQAFQSDAQNDIPVIPGAYSVVENAAVGYFTTYSNSANGNPDCNALALAQGQTVTCTITNNDIPPPPANACSLASIPGYTLVNGTGGADFVTLAPFTMFKGNGGNDTVVSNANGNYIVCTLGSNDVIKLSGSGAVTIDAGNGKNTIITGNTTGFITSGTGIDVLSLGNGARTINAGDGNNSVTTGNGNQTITTGSGDDFVSTNGGNDTVNAGAGKNKVITRAGTDSLTALGGDDFFDAGAGSDTCSAGGGTNTVVNCAP